jgi:hypothetical protein
MRPAREEAGCARVKRLGSRLAVYGVSCLAALLVTSAAHAGDALVCGIEQGHCKTYKEQLWPKTPDSSGSLSG